MNSEIKRISSVDYALTFTLKPHMYSRSVEEQLQIAEGQIFNFIVEYKAKGVMVYELTKNANVHFHALFQFEAMPYIISRMEYVVKDYFRKSKVIGFICMKQCTNFTGQLKYMFKDYEHTSYTTEIDPVRYNERRYKYEFGEEYDITKSNYVQEYEIQEIIDTIREENQVVKNPMEFHGPILPL